jgi:hypothetical protein
MSDRVIDAADAWAIDLKVRRDNPTIAFACRVCDRRGYGNPYGCRPYPPASGNGIDAAMMEGRA